MSEDRKARLAALRKSRYANENPKVAAPSLIEHTNNISLEKVDQYETELISQEPKRKEQEIKKDQQKEPIPEDQLDTKEDQEEGIDNLDVSFDIDLDSEPAASQKISYTKEMKKDLEHYYHKAELRNNRAINKIIQDKLVQET